MIIDSLGSLVESEDVPVLPRLRHEAPMDHIELRQERQRANQRQPGQGGRRRKLGERRRKLADAFGRRGRGFAILRPKDSVGGADEKPYGGRDKGHHGSLSGVES